MFARDGLDGVSLAQVNRAAGQRNATALHYHFGGRDGLLQAIFDKHRPRVAALREPLQAALQQPDSVDELARILILPLLEQVRDPDGGCDYLQFLAQLMNHSQLQARGLDRQVTQSLVLQEQSFAAVLQQLPAALGELRLSYAVLMTFNGLGLYAARVSAGGFDEVYHDLVGTELVRAFSAVLDLGTSLVSG